MRSQTDPKGGKKKNVTSDDLPFDLDLPLELARTTYIHVQGLVGKQKLSDTVLAYYATDTGFNLQHHKT